MTNPKQLKENEVVVEVDEFATVKPKFTKEDWESGEGDSNPSDGDDSDRRVDNP